MESESGSVSRDRQTDRDSASEYVPVGESQPIATTVVWLLLFVVGLVPLFVGWPYVTGESGSTGTAVELSLVAVIAFGTLPLARRASERLFG